MGLGAGETTNGASRSSGADFWGGGEYWGKVWAKVRQGHTLVRMGQRYTPERLDAACRRALDVDLIDVRRVERILVQALEEEAVPQLPLPIPAGRFARPGSVFAHAKGGQS